MVDFYLTTMRMAIAPQFQYRVANYFYMIGMIAEPVIYLVVWSTIAASRAARSTGSRRGVRRLLHRLDARSEHEHRVHARTGGRGGSARASSPGSCCGRCIRIHYDLAFFAGWKFVVILLWLPIAAG